MKPHKPSKLPMTKKNMGDLIWRVYANETLIAAFMFENDADRLVEVRKKSYPNIKYEIIIERSGDWS
jgi:hypothetical protein